MIGSMGRAEALAAVALVVGARQEPIAAFRRLAVEDPALGVLGKVATCCANGVSLPDALVACHLLTRSEAVRLGGLPPLTMADELTRLAQRAAWPPTGEVLARWLPLWAVLAATIPSLVIGAVVALVGGALYGGIWQSLGLASPTHGPALWWFAQLADVVMAVLVVAGGWWLMRRIPVLRRLTVFSRTLERAAAVADLVRSARAGRDDRSALHAWAQRSGDPAGVSDAIAGSGGDLTATLMTLGVVPRRTDGRPDWDTALAETDRVRARAAQVLAPWLIAVLVLTGLAGFMTWELAPLLPFTWWWVSSPGTLSDHLFSHAVTSLKYAGSAVVAAHLLLRLDWLGKWLSGPARDWPMVADRVARALERREEMDQVLRGLRLAVDGSMRRRLTAALELVGETHPGIRLAKAGVIPRAQAQACSVADGADLPTLLRSASQVPEDHGLRVAANQAMALLTLAAFLALVQMYLLVGVFPKFEMMSTHLGADFRGIPDLAQWATRVSATMLVIAMVGGELAAVAHHHGWWAAAGGWARLARGLVLRRMLAAGADESALAHAVAALAPRRAARLTRAAQLGDLPGVLAAAGWSVRSPAELEQALVADLVRRDRRRARLALTARMLLPFLVALPVSLMVVAVSLTLTRLTHAQVLLAHGQPTGSVVLTGGTPGMALIFWWVSRCEAQGDAVVEQVRAEALLIKQQPPARVVPVKAKP